MVSVTDAESCVATMGGPKFCHDVFCKTLDELWAWYVWPGSVLKTILKALLAILAANPRENGVAALGESV